MRGAERQDDSLLGRRRLQLEVESLAKLLAQGEAPGAIDPAAERRVQDELHAAGLVEEALEGDGVGRGDDAETVFCFGEVLSDLLGCRLTQQILLLQELDRWLELAFLARLLGSGQLEIDRCAQL